MSATFTPTAITDHRHSGVLEIAWADGLTSQLLHTLLREQCRCGGCEELRRHGGGVPAAAEQLRLSGIEPIGENAVTLSFSDGHNRGIYPWRLLRELGAH